MTGDHRKIIGVCPIIGDDQRALAAREKLLSSDFPGLGSSLPGLFALLPVSLTDDHKALAPERLYYRHHSTIIAKAFDNPFR